MNIRFRLQHEYLWVNKVEFAGIEAHPLLMHFHPEKKEADNVLKALLGYVFVLLNILYLRVFIFELFMAEIFVIFDN